VPALKTVSASVRFLRRGSGGEPDVTSNSRPTPARPARHLWRGAGYTARNSLLHRPGRGRPARRGHLRGVEQAALAKGPRIGGLLNATFGNVPDLLVGYYGVRSGLLPFVKATLIGGIISNTGLVIGLAFLVAGLRYGFPRFDSREAGRHTVLLLLAISGLLLPTLLAAAAALAPVTNVLVDTVTPTVQTLGWTDTFVGIVLVANAGNAAEMYAAIAMACKGRLDLLLGVASGSSIQIATFV